jgi:hypothetical protein
MVVKHDSDAQLVKVGWCVHTSKKVVYTHRKPVMSPNFVANYC